MMLKKFNKPSGNTILSLIRKVTGPALYCFFAGLTITLALTYQFVEGRVEPGKTDCCPPTEHTAAARLDGEATAYKNETVYVILDHTGNLLEQRIINRIYRSNDPEAGQIADYGRYLSIQNMTSVAEPALKEDRVLWNSALLNDGDIYYEGVIDKKLPVEFEICYYLDGKPLIAPELIGKSGRLEIVITTRNNLVIEEPVSYYDYHGNLLRAADTNYVPLLVQGTYAIDLNRFSNVEAEDAVTVTTGQSMSINFMAFPYPEAELVFSMDGENIELNNILFTIIPQLPPMQEIDMEDDLMEMLEGVSSIGEGLLQLSGGANQLLHGLEQFQGESNRMLAEIDRLAAYLEQFEDTLEEIINGDLSEQLAEFISFIEELLENLDQLPDPAVISEGILSVGAQTGELEHRCSSLNRDTAALTSTSALVTTEAEKLIAENEEGSELYALGMLLLIQEEQIRRVAGGSASVSEGVTELQEAAAGLNSEWADNFMPNLQELQDTARELDYGMEDLLEYLGNILEEISKIEEYQDDIEEMLAAAEEMFENLAELPRALEQMVDGQRQLRDGLDEMHSQGILEMKNGLIAGFNEVRFGAAKVDLMRSLADNYRSHADNEHNRNSDVQFIIQVEKVKEQESDLTEDNNYNSISNEEVTLWGRFLGLFDIFSEMNFR